MTSSHLPPADLAEAMRNLNQSIDRIAAAARLLASGHQIRQRGQAWRWAPGPPIDETLWLRTGIIATVPFDKEKTP